MDCVFGFGVFDEGDLIAFEEFGFIEVDGDGEL